MPQISRSNQQTKFPTNISTLVPSQLPDNSGHERAFTAMLTRSFNWSGACIPVSRESWPFIRPGNRCASAKCLWKIPRIFRARLARNFARRLNIRRQIRFIPLYQRVNNFEEPSRWKEATIVCRSTTRRLFLEHVASASLDEISYLFLKLCPFLFYRPAYLIMDDRSENFV